MSDRKEDDPPNGDDSSQRTEPLEGEAMVEARELGSLGDFRLLRCIGRGGMATVYEAFQASMRRHVALKVLAPGHMFSEKDVTRFEREAWIGGRLSHPNIVTVFGQGRVGETHYLAMELVHGGSLQDSLKKSREGARRDEGATSLRSAHVREMCRLFAGVADGLDTVHRQKIIHRDIKPGNLLFTADGSRLLLSDFGLARGEDATLLTRRGDFLGTVRYMSPEQLLASRVHIGHPTDIYSLGVSLYEAVTLTYPFAGDSEEAYLASVTTKEPIPPRRRNPAVPRDLETILLKCMERDPDQRYASAADLRDDLNRLLQHQPVRARRLHPFLRAARWARRHRRTLAGGAMVGLVLSGLVILGRSQWERSRQTDRELGRIRSAVEEGLPQNRSPGDILNDWESARALLLEQIRRNPHGPDAVLAHRAGITLRLAVPPFGLVSDPPAIRCFFVEDSLLIRSWAALVLLEASWDRRPWRRLGWWPWGGGAQHCRLASFLSGTELSAAPHRLDLRATIRYFDRTFMRDLIASWNDKGPTDIPASLAGPPLFEETRSLGSHTLALYDVYPADVPRAVHTAELDGPISRWFRVDHVRLDRQNSGKLQRIALQGRMDFQIPCPLAATASLVDSTGSALVAGFPLAFCARVVAVGQAPGESGYFLSGDAFMEPENEIDGVGLWSPSWSGRMQGRTADGVQSGRLILEPSRSVALGSGWIDRYFGEVISFPVTIDVRTEADSAEADVGAQRPTR